MGGGYLDGSFRAGGEDIWFGGCWDGCGCLGGSLKARGEDVIKGLRPHICSPLCCWNVGGHGSTVSKHKFIIANMRKKYRFLWNSYYMAQNGEACF